MAITRKHDLMAKLDLANAFHQLPIHPKDGVYMGMRLEDNGDIFIPTRAVFGGKIYPFYCNAIMADRIPGRRYRETAAVLRLF